jgi:pimeloyl-ACP methyl ester carboxylesterase
MVLKIVLGLALLSLAVLAAWLWTPDQEREKVEALYALDPDDFVTVLGLRLHLRDSGTANKPALLMLHGLGASLHTWETWANSLSDDFRVIRFDLPGAGLTGPDPGNDYSTDHDMAVLEAVLDTLQLERTHLMGHSMGGRLAWNFAARFPARVNKLILLAPDGYASPGFEYDRPPELPAMLSLMQYVLPRFMLRMTLEPAYADSSWMTEAMTRRYYDLMLAPGVRQAMLARMQQTILTEPAPLLRKISAPTLLIWGEEDAMIPLANATDYQAALADVELVTFSGIGHLPQEEQPEKALVAVRKFLTASP